MTPRSLFVIIVKILGLFMLKEVIFSGVTLFNGILFVRASYGEYGSISLLPSILSFILYLSIFLLLIFKSDVIIDKLKLDDGFYEEQFTMSMDNFMIFRIAVIVVGLYLLVDTVPVLCKDIVGYYQESMYANSSDIRNTKAQGLVYNSVKLVAAYVMLVNSSYLAAFIINRNKEKAE